MRKTVCDWLDLFVKALLDHGANVNAGGRRVLEAEANFTALHFACDVATVSAVKQLLSSGADPNRQTATAMKTPLHIAAAHGAEAMIQALIDAGADTRTIDRDGMTPVDVALEAGNIAAARLIAGSDVADRMDEKSELQPVLEVPGGGWNQTVVDPWSRDRRCCDFHRIDGTDMEAMRRVWKHAYFKPVIITGNVTGGDWAAHNLWRRDEFLRRYSHLPLTVGANPARACFLQFSPVPNSIFSLPIRSVGFHLPRFMEG